jgi:predicted RNA-binding protein with PUA-like domain
VVRSGAVPTPTSSQLFCGDLTMRYWLMKSEPEDYSVLDWKKDKKTLWTGVRNYQARNFMTQEMTQGDAVLFYHSNAEPPGVAGLGRISSEAAVADPTQFDKKSESFEQRATKDKPVWSCVEVEWIETLEKFVGLQDLKNNSKLADMLVLRKGNRLSIVPVTEKEFREVCRMGGAKGRI